jgi:hypothetical protein
MRLCVVAILCASGCAPLATSPSWAGGGLQVTGPVGVPDVEPAVTSAASVDPTASAETIGARHILVMHADSQARPEGVLRTREQALQRAEEALAKLKAGADFGAMVDAYSDEPGAAERAGDLGKFGRNAMVKPFSDAAFKLKVGELSGIVETRYGFHVIKRTN